MDQIPKLTPEQINLRYKQQDRLSQNQLFNINSFMKNHGTSYFNFVLMQQKNPFLTEIDSQTGVFYKRGQYFQQFFYDITDINLLKTALKPFGSCSIQQCRQLYEFIYEQATNSQQTVLSQIKSFASEFETQQLTPLQIYPSANEQLSNYFQQEEDQEQKEKIKNNLHDSSILISPFNRQLQSMNTPMGSVPFIPFQVLVDSTMPYLDLPSHVNLTMACNVVLPYQFYTIIDGFKYNANRIASYFKEINLQQPVKLQGDLQGYEKDSERNINTNYYNKIQCFPQTIDVSHNGLQFPEPFLLMQNINTQTTSNFSQIQESAYKAPFCSIKPDYQEQEQEAEEQEVEGQEEEEEEVKDYANLQQDQKNLQIAQKPEQQMIALVQRDLNHLEGRVWIIIDYKYYQKNVMEIVERDLQAQFDKSYQSLQSVCFNSQIKRDEQLQAPKQQSKNEVQVLVQSTQQQILNLCLKKLQSKRIKYDFEEILHAVQTTLSEQKLKYDNEINAYYLTAYIIDQSGLQNKQNEWLSVDKNLQLIPTWKNFIKNDFNDLVPIIAELKGELSIDVIKRN